MGRLGDSIAVLEGFESSTIDVSPDDADGRIGQVRAGIPGMFGDLPGVTSKRNMITTDGANYGGGSSFAPGLPLMPSSVGLADLGVVGYGRAGLGDGYGRAGLGAGCGCGTMADSDLASAFEAYDVSPDNADGRIGQTRAFPNQYATEIMPDVTRRVNMITTDGANYGGGSSFAPGLPLMPSTVGLADFHDQALIDYMNAASGPAPGVLPARRNVVDPSGGQNYTGGASFAPGMPLLVSSAGLAELNYLDALDAVDRDRFTGKLTSDGRSLFEKLAGKVVLTNLKAQMRLAKAQRNASAVAALSRQFAIARRLRRALFRYPLTNGVMNAVALSKLAQQIAAQVANARPVAIAA